MQLQLKILCDNRPVSRTWFAEQAHSDVGITFFLLLHVNIALYLRAKGLFHMYNTNADPDEKIGNRAVEKWYMFRTAVQVQQKVYFTGKKT